VLDDGRSVGSGAEGAGLEQSARVARGPRDETGTGTGQCEPSKRLKRRVEAYARRGMIMLVRWRWSIVEWLDLK
jgi:hypothetical protein